MKEFKVILNKHHLIYLLFLLAICLYSTGINWIPDGYVIATGDKPFPANIGKSYSNYLYEWGHTAGDGYTTPGEPAEALHNGMFYIFDLFGLKDNQKQNIKYFYFIFFSSFSMYLSLGILFRCRITPTIQFIVAIFYAFNHFTLDAAITTGLYYPYFDLYIYLPLIWTFFTKGLIDKKTHYLALSGILVFLSVGGFANPSFLFLLFILLGFTAVSLLIFGLIDSKQIFIAIGTVGMYLALIAFYFLPYLNNFIGGTVVGQSQNLVDLKNWITWQSTHVLYVFRFSRNDKVFPEVYPYDNSFQWLFVLLSFYPIIIVCLGLISSIKEKKELSWIQIIFGILFLFFIFGSAKTTLSEGLTYFVFTKPLFLSLRSSDKFIIMLPFFTGIFLYYFLEKIIYNLKVNRVRIISYLIILGVILAYPAPFYLGKINQNVSISHVWDYKYTTMVKMPNSYKDLADYINLDKDYFKILVMPYTGQIGLGWVLRPTWRYIGVDYTAFYSNNPVLVPVNSFGQFTYANYLVDHHRDGKKSFTQLVRSKGVRYVIINPDVSEDRFITSFRDLFKELKNDFIFIKSFGGLELYRISPSKELNVIYAAEINEKNRKVMEKNLNSSLQLDGKKMIYTGTDKIVVNILEPVKNEDSGGKNNAVSTNFEKINPTKYIVNVENVKEPFWLVFLDTYHPQWELYGGKQNDNKKFEQIGSTKFTLEDIKYLFHEPITNEHYIVNGYANAWYIEPQKIGTGEKFTFVLYFKPQSYLYVGLIISGLTFIGCVGYLVWYWRKRYRKVADMSYKSILCIFIFFMF